MPPFSLEHSKAAYCTDFVLYGVFVLGLGIYLALSAPRAQALELLAIAALGALGWTLIEYVLHRFVLHELPPFKKWHEDHHRQPTALICTPTILSASLIGLLIFLPALALGDYWHACALTLGLTGGYLMYATTHHAIHHWRLNNAWLQRRKRWHAMHHYLEREGGYGVTSAFWDHAFASTGGRR